MNLNEQIVKGAYYHGLLKKFNSLLNGFKNNPNQFMSFFDSFKHVGEHNTWTLSMLYNTTEFK